MILSWWYLQTLSGGPLASTGSVGAGAAASRTEAPTPSPSAPRPSRPTAIMDNGIVMASRRDVVARAG
ncbi:hypothetical protein ABZX92_31425 [Lentzea sp. NPDC006480]|uniref:hypothetical protein n=1 Tax=Lentzea sp. NPDC006480 TaxID=3157176 RepID=UPI0033A752B6